MKENTTGDSIVDEVRAIRAQIAEECGYDMQRIAERAAAFAATIPGLKYVTLEELRRRKQTTTPRDDPKSGD